MSRWVSAVVRRLPSRISHRRWLTVDARLLPFADAASAELPLGRLLRLSLFQVAVGMATALIVGTLNRVLIVELGVAAWLVSAMVALPILAAPLRALIGFRSDNHRSVLGWRRVPYLWLGTILQFGGLAIMPFALMVLAESHAGLLDVPEWFGQIAAALAFLLMGAGLQTVQTAGLALATDLAPEDTRPRVVALLYVMLLVGLVGSGVAFGFLLADFTPTRLIQVVQGAAVITVLLNLVALWKQEARDPSRTRGQTADRPDFRASWRSFVALPGARRFLAATGLGTLAFNMQDIILEPYGGEILRLGVGATSQLTGLTAIGALAAFALAARILARGIDPIRVSATGLVAGLPAFALVICAAPLDSPLLFRIGAMLIGFGSGLFAVGTLTAAMGMETPERVGLALGAWGAMQATAAGVAVAAGGAIRDIVSALAAHGGLGGAAAADRAIGYSVVYHLELYLLFAALIAIGPLVRSARRRPLAQASSSRTTEPFGLAEFPG
jgi:BCD family chlorophyll transporter-like MFS transporter